MRSEVVRGAARDSVLFRIAAAILVLNLLDGVLTLTAVHAGAASEANPLMATSMGWGSVWFILVKLSLVSLGVALLWRARHRALAVCGLVGLCVVYSALLGYHAIGLEHVASLLT